VAGSRCCGEGEGDGKERAGRQQRAETVVGGFHGGRTGGGEGNGGAPAPAASQ